MGYFSNGTEGECYFEDYCSKCVHNGDGDGPMCPVWLLHLEFNYDECNKPESFLHRLIPRTEGGLSNGECKMFLAAPSVGRGGGAADRQAASSVQPTVALSPCGSGTAGSSTMVTFGDADAKMCARSEGPRRRLMPLVIAPRRITAW